jgi:hypothetical protein
VRLGWLIGGGYPTHLFWHNMSNPGRCVDFAFKTYGFGSGNEPPSIPIITGPVEGKVNIASEYKLVATDPEGDDVYYFIDWQDNTTSGWIGPYPSGLEITESHTWSTERKYTISVRAKDTNSNEGDWATLTVTIPYSMNTPFQQFLAWLFQRFPNAFPILRNLMGY